MTRDISVSVLGMVVLATAPKLEVLALGAVLVGMTSVVAQIIVPFAAHLAAAHERGRIVSTVMSGLLIGVLVSRTVAGLLAQIGGWQESTSATKAWSTDYARMHTVGSPPPT